MFKILIAWHWVLSNRTADKQKPGPLEMALVFKEAVRNKRLSNKSASLRDLLNSAVAEYNRKATTKARNVILRSTTYIKNCLDMLVHSKLTNANLLALPEGLQGEGRFEEVNVRVAAVPIRVADSAENFFGQIQVGTWR